MKVDDILSGETLAHIQDTNSSDSIIYKMYLRHAHTHAHKRIQIAAEPLEKSTTNVFRKLACLGFFFPIFVPDKQQHIVYPHSM